MSGDGEVNVSALNECWRQRVKKEAEASRYFLDEYGWMCHDQSEGGPKRQYATQLVKYFDPVGGTWTVQTQRVPLKAQEADKASDSLKKLFDSCSTVRELVAKGDVPPMPSMDTTILTHRQKMEQIGGCTAHFRTTASNFGSRRSLEQFGTSEHGLKSSLTKTFCR